MHNNEGDKQKQSLIIYAIIMESNRGEMVGALEEDVELERDVTKDELTEETLMKEVMG